MMALFRSLLPSSAAVVAASLAALAPTALAQDAPPRVLFVRGGSGSGGFLSGGADTHLSSIHDGSTAVGNTGWGMLAAILTAEGFALTEVSEGPGPDGVAVDLDALDLSQYEVVVFGSNNAAYGAIDRDRVAAYVCAGGGVLFLSDANFGSDWHDAPDSDQTFLDAFDLEMNQDGGTYAVARQLGDFVVNGVDHGTHPILAGPDGQLGGGDDVDAFGGEGVSPVTVTHSLPGIEPVVLAKAKGNVHQNDAQGSGSSAPAGVDDGALVVASHGAGRVAGYFDRNTFFNPNGAGTSLLHLHHQQLAKNLFRWLAGPEGPSFGAGCPAGSAKLTLEGCATPGASVTLELHHAQAGAALLFVSTATAPAGSCLLVAPPLVALGPFPTTPPRTALTASVPPGAPPAVVHVQAALLQPAVTSNGLQVAVDP